MCSFLWNKTCFHTGALMKHLLLWQKTLSPPEKQEIACSAGREPEEPQYAEVHFFRVAPRLDARPAVLLKGQWFSSNGNICHIFMDWWTLLLSSKHILFATTRSRRLEQNNEFAAAECVTASMIWLVSKWSQLSFLVCFFFFFLCMKALPGKVMTTAVF